MSTFILAALEKRVTIVEDDGVLTTITKINNTPPIYLVVLLQSISAAVL
jgi:hypothetical protein